ncbi:MAG: hypothetical protein PW791_16400 [Neorhizobium sp.]|nr:hypothetical protein [Neorhizobium sp.]
MIRRLKQIIHFLLQPLRLLGAWLDRELMGTPIAEQPPLIRNEILKLRAQSVDRLSTACFSLGAAGALAPVVAAILRGGNMPGLECAPSQRDSIISLQCLAPSLAAGDARWTVQDVVGVALPVALWLIFGFVLHMIGEIFLTKLGDHP